METAKMSKRIVNFEIKYSVILEIRNYLLLLFINKFTNLKRKNCVFIIYFLKLNL